MAELTRARDAATLGDMVELRLDGIADLDVAGALRGCRRPVIVTCRPGWEGGQFTGSEAERHAILEQAFIHGADYVDVEWRAGFDDLVRTHGARLVLSSHDFDGVPPDLSDRVRSMRATGAAVVKIAVTANRLTDALALFDIARDGDAVVIAMGDAGVTSRLLASRFGSKWTYAGNGVAPGQVPARQMLERFRFRQVGARTAVYGVVGNNVQHSLSPVMHNAAFAAAGIDAVYVPLLASDFDDFLTFADALRVAGVSVTVPFKIDALGAARAADEIARAVGAANTLKRRNGGWDATNTDVEGFLAPLLATGTNLAGARVAVLGAGGASRAVAVGLASVGAEVTVHARRDEQAAALAAALPLAPTGSSRAVKARPWPPLPGSWDVLVNCTPLGGATAREVSPLPGGPFGGRLVYDLTYGPGESRLLHDARQSGCQTLDGLAMLIAQAERQFEWWTGRRPVSGVMQDAAFLEVGHPHTEAESGRGRQDQESCI
jgi:3-dehydroquinate dehydratase/shikimate dehydrogenase